MGAARTRSWTGLVALALALGSGARAARAAPTPVTLAAPARVDAVRLADVDGDGLTDVLTLSARRVDVWLGRAGQALAPAPSLTAEVPADVSFVDVARRGRPALLGLGADGPVRLRLDASGPAALERLPGGGLGWRDGEKPAFAALHPGGAGDPTHVLPGAGGWVWADAHETAWNGRSLGLPVRAEVLVPGPFLEESAQMQVRLPALYAPPLAAKPAAPSVAAPAHLIWALAEERLVCLTGPSPLAYDLSFLPSTGDRTLVDLDGDRLPDLVHRDGDTREGRYAFFRIPAPEARTDAEGRVTFAPVGRDPRPPAAFLRLAGFNLDPDYVDVDGDGLLDFVITTIAVDAPNTLRAVSSGRVTATTLCFRQRPAAAGQPLYPPQPDASVTSDIGVKIRFGATGNLDVARSFTIVSTADVDGDGRRDLLIRLGPDALALRRGVESGVWAAEPTLLPVPPLAPGEELEAHPADLDGRPGDELVLHYRSAEGKTDRLVSIRPIP